jgi:hypothetical protein
MTLTIMMVAVFWAFCNGYVCKDIEETEDKWQSFREDVGRTLPGRLFYFPVWIWTSLSERKKVAE